MNPSIKIDQINSPSLLKGIKAPYYFIYAFDGKASFSVDFTEYKCSGKTLLFLSPYQFLKWESPSPLLIDAIQFHGDFYCIEYHKKEVACNGLLFNNIYQQAFVQVNTKTYKEVIAIIRKMQDFTVGESLYNIPIIKSYLQLILALGSKEKQLQLDSSLMEETRFENITSFQNQLETHFLETKEVAFYAEKFGLAVNTFGKKIKKHFGKSPTKLIQERIVLEAKKLLHLTHKPVKEIAAELNFEDEFYFSRYFKKEVGVSPKQFREKTGISIVAEKSM